MNPLLRGTLQLAKWFAACVIVVVLVLVVAIQIDQRLMRRDAEALLSDLSKLKVGITTQAEAQPILRRWQDAARLEGKCQNGCWVGITLNSFPRKHNSFFMRHRHFLRLYKLLGGQLAELRAAAEFVDGVFQTDTVGAYLYVAPYREMNNTWPEYTLIGGAGIFRELPRLGRPLQARDNLHPTYLVSSRGGCDGCMLIDVRFMPDITSYDRNRLMQFDFSCLTRWLHPCRTQADIMPAAWQQFLDDQAHQ